MEAEECDIPGKGVKPLKISGHIYGRMGSRLLYEKKRYAASCSETYEHMVGAAW